MYSDCINILISLKSINLIVKFYLIPDIYDEDALKKSIQKNEKWNFW